MGNPLMFPCFPPQQTVLCMSSWPLGQWSMIRRAFFFLISLALAVSCFILPHCLPAVTLGKSLTSLTYGNQWDRTTHTWKDLCSEYVRLSLEKACSVIPGRWRAPGEGWFPSFIHTLSWKWHLALSRLSLNTCETVNECFHHSLNQI